MEITFESVSAFFDDYFNTLEECMGPIEKVPKIARFFAEDMEFHFMSYNEFSPGRPLTREEVLGIFIHPGVKEKIVPLYYTVNLKEKICVVLFEDQISDSTGNLGKKFYCSVHYTFRQEADGSLKIIKILDFTGDQDPEEVRMHLGKFSAAGKAAVDKVLVEWLKARY